MKIPSSRRPASRELQELLTKVSRTSSVVAAFDVDGTLTNGGSTYPWLAAVGGRSRTMLACIKLSPQIFLAGLLGGSRADQTKERTFTAILHGVTEEHVRVVSTEFAARHYRKRLRPEVKAMVDWHQHLGHKVVLVSASVEAYIGPIGDLLRADAVLSTRLGVTPARTMSGHYDGRNCRGEEKIARLTNWMHAQGLERDGEKPLLVAYGNSRGDARMLAAADLGINCGKLGALSRLRSYPELAQVTLALAEQG